MFSAEHRLQAVALLFSCCGEGACPSIIHELAANPADAGVQALAERLAAGGYDEVRGLTPSRFIAAYLPSDDASDGAQDNAGSDEVGPGPDAALPEEQPGSLLSAAAAAPLRLSQQGWLVSRLASSGTSAVASDLLGVEFAALAEHNPAVAAEVSYDFLGLLCCAACPLRALMLALTPPLPLCAQVLVRCADVGTQSALLAVLAKAELSVSQLACVGSALGRAVVPTAALAMFAASKLDQGGSMADRVAQRRMANILCAFLDRLVVSEPFAVLPISVEVEDFCTQFFGVARGAAGLYAKLVAML